MVGKLWSSAGDYCHNDFSGGDYSLIASDVRELYDLFSHDLSGRVQEGNRDLEGMIFVITGAVEHFANRKELKEHIESRGGKVTGSVTSKTTYLINNDAASGSSKNKKAKELGISILTEEQFLNL